MKRQRILIYKLWVKVDIWIKLDYWLDNRQMLGDSLYKTMPDCSQNIHSRWCKSTILSSCYLKTVLHVLGHIWVSVFICCIQMCSKEFTWYIHLLCAVAKTYLVTYLPTILNFKILGICKNSPSKKLWYFDMIIVTNVLYFVHNVRLTSCSLTNISFCSVNLRIHKINLITKYGSGYVYCLCWPLEVLASGKHQDRRLSLTDC